METPRLQHQQQLQNLRKKLEALRNSIPEEIEYRNNVQEYYTAMRSHQEEQDHIRNQIHNIEKKEIKQTPSQKAAHLDIRDEGFSLN
jgi:carbonic anhydrase